MDLAFGIATSEHADSRVAGATLAREAAARCQGPPRVALCFATSRHSYGELAAAVRAELGPSVRLSGGSSLGIISHGGIGYDGFQSGLLLLGGDALRAELFVARGLHEGGAAAGAALAAALGALPAGEPRNLLLFHETVSLGPDGGVRFSHLQPILEGMEAIQGAFPHAAGMYLRGDWDFTQPDHLFFDDEVLSDALSALCLSGGGLRMDTLTLHGCQPVSGYHTVTAASGAVVEAIDGVPAIAFVCQRLGVPESLLLESMSSFTLGRHRAPRFSPFREEDYINRVALRPVPERGGILFVEPDLQPGTEVQIMRRHIDMDAVVQRVRAFRQGLPGRRPLFALYIDCGGRTAPFAGTGGEEAEAVLRGLGDLPLLGVYGSGEMARVGGRLHPLSWTGVLCLFST